MAEHDLSGKVVVITGASSGFGAASSLACSGGTTSASVTPSLTEGPYYKQGSPEQANLYTAGMAGTKLVVTGSNFGASRWWIANDTR